MRAAVFTETEAELVIEALARLEERWSDFYPIPASKRRADLRSVKRKLRHHEEVELEIAALKQRIKDLES